MYLSGFTLVPFYRWRNEKVNQKPGGLEERAPPCHAALSLTGFRALCHVLCPFSLNLLISYVVMKVPISWGP